MANKKHKPQPKGAFNPGAQGKWAVVKKLPKTPSKRAGNTHRAMRRALGGARRGA
jgi:hypothetical protein